MAKKRIKKQDDVYTILTFDQVDTHLAKLAALQHEQQVLEATADAMINQVKADLKKQSKPIQAKMQKHVRSLEVFCDQHRGEFGKRQSIKRIFGVVGWRKSSSISVKTKTTLDLIKSVFKSKAAQFIRTEENPDKVALAKLTDEQLASVDARRVHKEEFFAEPDLTQMDDGANG